MLQSWTHKVEHFLGILWCKVISWSWNQNILLSRSCYLTYEFEKIHEIFFWKVFPFGLAWVNKLSNKNYLMLFYVKPNGNQALDRDFWFNPRVIRMYSSKCFSKMLYSKLQLVKKMQSLCLLIKVMRSLDSLEYLNVDIDISMKSGKQAMIYFCLNKVLMKYYFIVFRGQSCFECMLKSLWAITYRALLISHNIHIT